MRTNDPAGRIDHLAGTAASEVYAGSTTMIRELYQVAYQHGPDRPRRDLKQGSVLVGPLADEQAGIFDRTPAAPGHILDFQVLDDDDAVDDRRGYLVRASLLRRAYLACNRANLRFAFLRLREPLRATLRCAIVSRLRSAEVARGRSMTVPSERTSAWALAQFTTLNPTISIVIAITGRTPDLIEDGFDLAIRVMPAPDSTLMMRRLGAVHLRGMWLSRVFCRAGNPGGPNWLITIA
jgi:hypothetical protein